MLFKTYVQIPESIITKMGNEMKNAFISALKLRKDFDDNKPVSIETMEMILDNIIEGRAGQCQHSRRGFTLKREEIHVIAREIRNERKIGAIKEFRTFTGAGLKDSKSMMDQFEMNELGAIQFITTFA